MKNKFFITCIILISFNLFSQNRIIFKNSNQNRYDLGSIFKKYQILEIQDDVHSISDGDEFILTYGKDYPFILHENILLASDYTVNIKTEKGIETKNRYDLGFDGKYFKNKNSSSNYHIDFSVFENKYTIYVKDFENEFYIEPLKRYYPNASANEYVFYKAEDTHYNPNLRCGNKDEITKPVNANKNLNLNAMTNTIVPIEVNFCVDYPMYTDYNSVNGVINRNLEILNATQFDYSIANGLAYDVNFILKKHYIITCNNCNYWPSTTNLSTNLDEFQSNGYNGTSSYKLMFNFYSADIKVYWIGHSDPLTNYIGLGTLNRLLNCHDSQGNTNVLSATSTLLNYPTDLNSTRMILSHELGHNFGCNHVNSYTNNIMFGAGSINTHVWDQTSKDVINNTITYSNCWYNNISGICDAVKVNDLVINVNSSNKSINLSWTPEAGKEYKVRLYNFTTNSWSSVSTYGDTVNVATYNYNIVSSACSNKYKVEVIPTCSGIEGISETVLFTVPANDSPALAFQSTSQNQIICSGLNYTFSVIAQFPGTNPVYQWKVNNLNVGGNSPTFSSTTLQNNDVLSCQITSNEPCLTSQTATVSKTVVVTPQPCELANNEFNQERVEFFPNPVTGLFTIESKGIIKKVSVYNLLGQKLLDKENNNSTITIDMSMLSKSSYFVKVETDDSFSIIKIIKN